MNKYQSQISSANQPKYPPKKPAHLKKNLLAHQAWLNTKKARNQAQYLKRNPSAIRCLVCYSTKPKSPFTNWIEAKHYQSSLNTTKEIYIDNSLPHASEDGRQYIGSVFYCSLKCFNLQAEQQEREDWAKGECISCGQPWVVINHQCHELNHQKEMQYLPINLVGLPTKKGGGQ